MADTPATDAPAKAPSKFKSPLVIGLIAALVVALCIAAYAIFGHRTAGPVVNPPKPQVFLALDPSFVVNFKDGDSLRYLQLNVTLMAHDPETIDAAKQVDSVIRNDLILLLSQQDFKTLSSVEGKKALQASALKDVQKIVAEQYPHSTLSALYFTNFVME